jgi:hypothetical protein
MEYRACCTISRASCERSQCFSNLKALGARVAVCLKNIQSGVWSGGQRGMECERAKLPNDRRIKLYPALRMRVGLLTRV